MVKKEKKERKRERKRKKKKDVKIRGNMMTGNEGNEVTSFKEFVVVVGLEEQSSLKIYLNNEHLTQELVL